MQQNIPEEWRLQLDVASVEVPLWRFTPKDFMKNTGGANADTKQTATCNTGNAADSIYRTVLG